MFTWLPEEKMLFSCDFLGCHFCEPLLMDSRIIYHNEYWDALRYYFDCIFGPFPSYVQKGLAKIQNLDIDFVCSSHGPILTKGCNLEKVIALYSDWSTPVERAVKRIPIFFCTAYGNTSNLALAVATGVGSVFPDAEIGLYNIIEHDLAELTALMNESDAFLIGSPTINRDAVPPVWHLLSGIEAVGIVKRPVALFGSFGWSGEAIPHLAERLASVKANVFERQFKINFVPTEADLAAAEEFGAEFAKSI
jgi:flavorubredoxin